MPREPLYPGPEGPVMVRRVALLACVLLGAALGGCSTDADYRAAEAGEFRSQNLLWVDHEQRAGRN
jgi:hypothetical protein